jgi:hypothetical protein
MLSVVLFRVLCLPAFSLQTSILNDIKPQFYLLFCIDVKLESLTLRDENRLRVFENRVLKRIFGPKGEERTT